jgi:hypothetical protein
MLKLKKLIHEIENTTVQQGLQKAFAPTANQKSLAKRLMSAIKQGPKVTRMFLNSKVGKSEEMHDLLTKPNKEFDGLKNDDIIKISSAQQITVNTLFPSQNFIDLMQSISFPFGSYEELIKVIKNPIAFGTIIKTGNIIVDGHHRWSQIWAINPENGKVNAINIQWPATNTKELLALAQVTVAAKIGTNKTLPYAHGNIATNILGKSGKEIIDLIMQNINKQTDKHAPGPLLNNEMMNNIIKNKDGEGKIIYDWANIESNITDITQIRQAIATKAGNNLHSLPKNPDAPDRIDMPQFDTKRGGPSPEDVENDIRIGKLNIAPPFAKGVTENKLKSLFKKTFEELND